MVKNTDISRIGLTLLLCLVLVSCQSKGPEPTPTPTSPVITSDYFPHHLGCWWEYGDSKDEKKRVKHQVVNVGDSFFEVQVSNPNVSFMVFAESDQWILLQRDRIPDEDIVFEYTPPVPYLKKPLKSGDTWSHDGKGVHELTRHDDVTVGEPTKITVPAGTFEVLPISRTVKKGDRVDIEMEYWAKDVGLVKSDFQSGDYQSTLELQKFHIPPR